MIVASIEYAEACAFLGNSLLSTMRQTGDAGLQPAFWAAFPDFEDEEVGAALDGCFAWAQAAADRREQGEDVLTEVCVEFTRLFVGPSAPAAAPWESFYAFDGIHVGFGEPTFQMQEELRRAELQVINDNNQYADHMGIELLLLSELCRRGDEAAASAFAEKHPKSWCEKFANAVESAAPGGYYAHLAKLICALL